MSSPVHCEIDFSAPGKQVGYARVPHSRNDSAWGSVLIPIAVIQNGIGPTIYLNAGTHGGEYEGAVSLLKLLRSLTPEEVSGRVIITPVLNPLAMRAGERLNPADGKDLNRVFPGDPRGTMSQVIAHYVSETILPLADVVLDLHSGGSSLQLLPYASMHYLADPRLFEETFAAMRAFGAPYSLLIREFSGPGLLDYEVESRGKVFLCPEVGGSGTLEPHTLNIAEVGIRNVLKHFGVLAGEPLSCEDRGLPPSRLLEVPDADHYYLTELAGIFEPCLRLGDEVNAGQLLGWLHSLEEPERPPQPFEAKQSGILLGRRAPGVSARGDTVAMVAVVSDDPVVSRGPLLRHADGGGVD